ncbi:MAG: exodeoxyribonuclease VII small subunit, partial [Planctomycetes bacterium]|nr:exodeoxyribonuclease VII small subunit [Planctomycetota bacterium]
MAKPTNPKDINTLNFEQAIKTLTTIVDKIEQGEVPLQDSLDQYETGMTLIKHCRTLLHDAEARIEVISKQDDGEIVED